MQSLPTAVTTSMLESMLKTIGKLPSAEIERHPSIITVHATKKATGQRIKVLSAATNNGSQWHVMAVPGLISAV